MSEIDCTGSVAGLIPVAAWIPDHRQRLNNSQSDNRRSARLSWCDGGRKVGERTAWMAFPEETNVPEEQGRWNRETLRMSDMFQKRK